MRNLKKILALVLALVMVVGMMTVATAAKPGTGYVDDAAIVNYDEAIQVLSALGVYRGDEKGNFNPNATITRGEFAAIVYRIVHDDVNDVYAGIYADYNKFDDVKASDWNAGYINYCANGEYILGDGAGNFIPNGKVNGYQVLAVMLRALGYDKEGEFQGAGWEVRTARKAKELGITTTVTEGTLGAPATRALVAELVYRSIAQASTVNYIKLVGYVKTGATLAYETFGLQGSTEELEGEQNETINGILDYADYHLYSKDDYETMITREPAAPDTDVEGWEKYGEPVAFWYASDLVSLANPTGAIEIRFNPVATYTNSLSAGTLYNLLYKVYDPYFAAGYFPIGHTIIDGVETDGGYAVYGNGTLFAGKGAVADVFVVEGVSYVVAKNTYADFVVSPYIAKGNVPMALATDRDTIDWNAYTYSTAAGIATGSLVLYNKYNSTIDYTTIHTASSKAVTLTNSYVPVDGSEIENCHAAYFKAGKTSYEYNINYPWTTIAQATELDLLDRDALEEVNYTQLVFFDDYGYVIFAMNVPQYGASGWMLVTNATYGGYSNDNGYYMNIKGYDLSGKAVTVKGGFDTFVYGTKTAAQDYNGEIGIYHYVVDTESGLYEIETETMIDAEASDDIKASEPCMGDYDVDGNTVYVIAKYNKSGLITGYKTVKGFKNIDDMVDAEIDGITDDYTAFEIAALNLDIYGEQTTEGAVEFVFVTGAKEKTDTKHKLTDWEEIFFLLDTTPEKQFAEYDLYNVVLNGKVTTLKVAANEYVFEDIGFYYVTDEIDDYASDFEEVEPGEIVSYGTDIMDYDGLVWDNAACAPDHGKIVLADNCKIVNVLTCTEVTAADLVVDSYYEVNALYWPSVAGVAAEYNQYGEVTVLYVVNGALVGFGQ